MWWLTSFADNPGKRPANPAGPAGSKPAQEPVEPQEEQEEEKAAIGSEANDVLRSMMPWLTSILFHLAIIVLALFMVWSIVLLEEEDDSLIIPNARLSDNPGAQLTTATQSQDSAASQQQRQVTSESVATAEASANLSGSATTSELQLVGLLGGGGGGGKLAPFGVTSGTASGLSASMFGTGGNATQIIYVIDASGSLIDTLPFVIKELKRSLSELSDKQKFTVIFFQAGQAIEVPPKGWKPATSEVKRKVMDWITLESMDANIIPRGSTTPESAFKLAMRYKPELLFVLSDNITGRGKYELDREELMQFLRESRKDNKRMAINTIQFIYPDPLKTLEEIAKEHGGGYKFIGYEDLGLR